MGTFILGVVLTGIGFLLDWLLNGWMYRGRRVLFIYGRRRLLFSSSLQVAFLLMTAFSALVYWVFEVGLKCLLICGAVYLVCDTITLVMMYFLERKFRREYHLGKNDPLPSPSEYTSNPVEALCAI